MKMYNIKYDVNEGFDKPPSKRSLNLLAETFEDAFILTKVRFPSMKILAISINDTFEVEIEVSRKELKNETTETTRS
jgi:hypothetical protein